MPRYSDYCIEAIESWFQDVVGLDWYVINTEMNMATPVVHQEIDFLAPLKFRDALHVKVFVERVGQASVTLLLQGQCRSGDENTAIFSAKFVYCFIDKISMCSVNIPAEYRANIDTYQQVCR